MSRGWHQTEEAKAKISAAARIQVRKVGYHLTDEHRSKISRALKGRHISEGVRVKMIGHSVSVETRMKIRDANIGRKHSDETKAKISVAKTGHCLTEEQRANQSRAKMGHIVSEGTRAKIRRRLMGNVNGLGNRAHTGRIVTPETRYKLSLAGKGRKDTEETKYNKSQARIGMKFTKEHCVSIGKSKKVEWQDPEWKDKVVKAQRLGCHVRPNKAESALLALLEHEYPEDWAFVGDGSFVIGGKNPDFVNVNGKKQIMELFGDYWHRGEEPQGRIDIFRSYGFNTLVIWESELAHPEKVLERITGFIMED